MTDEKSGKKPPSGIGGKLNPRRFAAARNSAAAGNRPGAAQQRPVEEGGDLSGLGTVVVRNEFYRDGYRSILRLAVIQGFIIIGLILAMFFLIHVHQPENRYFATTEDGRLVPMVALSEPNLSTPALMSWVAQAATEVMTFGFNDYRRRLQESSRNFTPKGWESFTQALQRSRIIEMVETNQQVVTAAPQGAPVLESEGIVQGRYQWVVQLPMILTYQSGSKTRADNLLVTLVVVRVSRLESASGVGIEQWIAVPR
ncbi:MAG: type IVB secretion system apparatus protein IcmL/DotI [Proteobacteria bacterium]|nr:type IVB secretion system apparatus protein IcmL/DotI [Pseudomonadota bacterium]